MSSAGRAANSNGCDSKPKEHATGLIGFAAQIRRSSLIGSCAMETAGHREPWESEGHARIWERPGVRFLRATRPSREWSNLRLESVKAGIRTFNRGPINSIY